VAVEHHHSRQCVEHIVFVGQGYVVATTQGNCVLNNVIILWRLEFSDCILKINYHRTVRALLTV